MKSRCLIVYQTNKSLPSQKSVIIVQYHAIRKKLKRLTLPISTIEILSQNHLCILFPFCLLISFVSFEKFNAIFGMYRHGWEGFCIIFYTKSLCRYIYSLLYKQYMVSRCIPRKSLLVMKNTYLNIVVVLKDESITYPVQCDSRAIILIVMSYRRCWTFIITQGILTHFGKVQIRFIGLYLRTCMVTWTMFPVVSYRSFWFGTGISGVRYRNITLRGRYVAKTSPKFHTLLLHYIRHIPIR